MFFKKVGKSPISGPRFEDSIGSSQLGGRYYSCSDVFVG